MQALLKEIDAIPTLRRFGRVASGSKVTRSVRGDGCRRRDQSLGGQVRLSSGSGKQISCEVVGFRDGRALVMPLGNLEGMSLSARADFEDKPAIIYPSTAWLGRVRSMLSRSLQDGKGPLSQGTHGLFPEGPGAD